MKYLAGLLSAGALITSACADPAANKPRATTSNSTVNSSINTTAAANTATAPAASASADVVAVYKPAGTVYAITPENGKIEFTGSKVTGRHDGGFKAFSGVVDVIGGKPDTSKVVFEVEMASVFTDAEGLTKHLQNQDFFDVPNHPKASFSSTSIDPDTAKGTNAYNVTGELVMRGMKKTVTFPATISIADPVVNVQADFSVNRKDFGMAYAGKADDLIRDDVVIKLSIKAGKK